MSYVYRLRAARLIGRDELPVLTLDWQVRAAAVTVLLGPGGTGKSALLRALAGRAGEAGLRLVGDWRYRNHVVPAAAPPGAPFDDILWLPQRRAFGVHAEPASPMRWRSVCDSPAGTLLLDEPSTGATPSEVDELVTRLRARALAGDACVLVTHDIEFARRVADDVALVCAGGLAAAGEAGPFFTTPPNELAARFLQQGNCWPSAPPVPPPPSHFRWLLPGRLAGMGRPGLLGDAEQDLAAIAVAGVRLVVSLTEDALPAGALRACGLRGRHFPIPDMGVPPVRLAANLCREIERALQEGDAVAVHCHAGLGRTGTMLAAMLVWLGEAGPEDAVARVRALGRGYVQTRGQELFVRQFADAVGPRRPPQGA
jgi:atypical dual specificity phosphatase